MKREFWRVRLEDVPAYEAKGWRVTERPEGVPFSLYSCGHGEETLMQRDATRAPWLEGRYFGKGCCSACDWELPRKLWWHDARPHCAACYGKATGQAPPPFRTAEDVDA